MDIFTQIVFVIGRLEPNGVAMLGTGFLVTADGLVATTHHVIGSSTSNLVLLVPHMRRMNDFQDLADNQCNTVPCTVRDIDPFRDLALLKTDVRINGRLPTLRGFDTTNVGDTVDIFGFPHCVEGRRALTLQRTEVGAKVLLDVNGVKSKHAVINTQARPGQSGSAVVNPSDSSISGILIGAWVPGSGGISLGGINPRELHQTTHCVSAEYLAGMI